MVRKVSVTIVLHSWQWWRIHRVRIQKAVGQLRSKTETNDDEESAEQRASREDASPIMRDDKSTRTICPEGVNGNERNQSDSTMYSVGDEDYAKYDN